MYSAITANKRRSVVLLLVFMLFAVGLSLLAGYAFNDQSLVGPVLIFAVIYATWAAFASSRLALAVNGAREIKKSDNPRLWRIVENLSITDGLPMPRVFIISDEAPNAFATGRDPAHACVVATSGLLEIMSDTELEGVFAHELGHVKNYDIRVSMIAFALVAVIGVLSDFFLRLSFWGGGRRRDDNNDGGQILALLGIVALLLSPLVASLLQLAISRRREYLADATGAMTTRYPEGLASALEKIKLHGSTLRRQNTSTAHFFIANPLAKKSIAALFDTHPPLDERIRKLREMSGKV